VCALNVARSRRQQLKGVNNEQHLKMQQLPELKFF